MTLELLIDKYWNLSSVTLKSMDGYDSLNYRVLSSEGTYVLKVYTKDLDQLAVIKAENEVLQSFQHGANYVPSVVANKQGQLITHDVSFPDQCFRMLSFLEGTFWGEISNPSKELFQSFGFLLGQLDTQLASLNPLAIKAKKIVWDLDNFLLNQALIKHITQPGDRMLVEYFFLQYRERVLPLLPQLRKSLIHNDANDWNVLIEEDTVTGIIDFGDMVYSSLINELAVGLAYVLMDNDNPLESACQVVRSYHQVIPLQESELDILYYLIAARLCTSVCNSAKTKKEQPDKEYITISERPAWNLLRSWIAMSPYKFSCELKKACGVVESPQGSDTDQLLMDRQQHLGSALSLSYKRPIHIHSAAFQYMYDAEGNAILDAYNNIKHVGHCHPHVVSAGQRAMSRLNTNTRYLYNELTDYAEHLLSYFPEELCKVYFVNSGSAASDLAIRMAQTYTQRHTVAVIKHGYHGNSRTGIDISHYKYAHKGGTGRQDNIIEAELPDSYRGRYTDSNAGNQYAIDFINHAEGKSIGAFIAEPIVGCGGQVPLAPGYLKEIYPYIRAHGGVCISDEVQVGFGRLGSHFWGFEMHEVLPDMVIIGKPMGNGHPLAAVVCTADISDAFDNGMEFFSSFGGNPVSCAIGKAVLEVIESESLQQNAKSVGHYMMDRFKELQQSHDGIGDVRGAGLFIGIDIIEQQSNKEPNRALASIIKNELRERSILVSTDGPDNNVIKIKPPLCFNKDNVDQLIEAFQGIL